MTARAETTISVDDNFWCIQVYETAAKNLALCCPFVLRYGVQIYALLWYYAAYSSNSLPTFRDDLSVPVLKGKKIEYPRLSNKRCTKKTTHFILTRLFLQDLWVSRSFNKSEFYIVTADSWKAAGLTLIKVYTKVHACSSRLTS